MNDFAKAMEQQFDADKQNAQVLQYANEHKWNVIFDIVWIFPLYQSGAGYNIIVRHLLTPKVIYK